MKSAGVPLARDSASDALFLWRPSRRERGGGLQARCDRNARREIIFEFGILLFFQGF